MNRREYVALFLGSGVLVGASATGAADRVVEGGATRERESGSGRRDAGVHTSSEVEQVTGTETETDTETETESPESTGSFGPRTFTGRGTSTSDEFSLRPGPITATFSHDGESNFGVELFAVEGESYEDVTLVNRIGAVEGSHVRSVRADGPHVLNVDADGDWEVTLEQPADPTVTPLPVEESGSGATALGPFAFDGATRVEASHDGDSNFIVQTVPLDPSQYGTLVFNEIGEFEGSTTERIRGPAYVDVSADGDWTLSFTSVQA